MLFRTAYWLACVWVFAIITYSIKAKKSRNQERSAVSSSLQAENTKDGLCFKDLTEDKCTYRTLGGGYPKRVYKFVINEMLNSGWERYNKTSDIPTSERVLHVCCGGQVLYLTAPKMRVNGKNTMSSSHAEENIWRRQ